MDDVQQYSVPPVLLLEGTSTYGYVYESHETRPHMGHGGSYQQF